MVEVEASEHVHENSRPIHLITAGAPIPVAVRGVGYLLEEDPEE